MMLMTDEKTIVIRITRANKDRLARYGVAGESMNDALEKVLDRLEELEKKEKQKLNPLEAQLAMVAPALA